MNTFNSGYIDKVSSNNVIKNTFLMLLLTLVPTIIGAFASIQLMPMLSGVGSIALLIGTLIASIALIFLINKNQTNGLGVMFLLLFTGVMGFSIGPLINSFLNIPNGPMMVIEAFGLTMLALFVSYIYSATTKKNLSFMGGFLMVGLFVLIGASLIGMFVHSTVYHLAITTIGAIIFSLFLLYDVNRVVLGGETNYVLATLSIYLDLFNLFLELLKLLSIFNNSDD